MIIGTPAVAPPVKLIDTPCPKCGRPFQSTSPERLTWTCGHFVARADWEARKPTRPAGLPTFSAPELLSRELPEATPVVPQVLYEGGQLLAGRPKTGKSFLALGIAISVACGGRALGQIGVEAGDVLYCALEDGERRLQGRLIEMLGDTPAPERLHLATEWRRLDEGGRDDLELWLAGHPEARLVVLDTLKRVRPRAVGNARPYDLDYDAVAPLNDLAHRYRVCILIVHHTRKMDADDPMDLISGTLGLTGAVDGAVVLRRGRGKMEATLAAAHRDAEDSELALRWDVALGGWLLLGDAEEHRRSSERTAVLRLLHDATEPPTPKDVAEALGKSHGAIKKLLWTMAGDGEVRSDGGRYIALAARPADDSVSSGNSGNPVTRPDGDRVKPVTTATADGNPAGNRVTAPSASGNPDGVPAPDGRGATVTRLPRLPIVPESCAKCGASDIAHTLGDGRGVCAPCWEEVA